MPHLLFLKDGRPLIKRPLDQTRLVIGRDTSCDIQLLEPEISRRHCEIERQNGFFILKDLSRNGTFLNQKRIQEARLKSDDQIQIGPWLLNFFPEESLRQADTIVTEKKTSLTPKAVSFGPMLGGASSMKEVFGLIRKAASSDITACLIGESGTGKELAARLIHDLSNRRGKPFVAINCGAIPQNLIESLLFGHEKGSFTGAVERQTGVFEQAHEGTLFLDEIGEMPLDLQTRLLRVLENQTLRRIGGKTDIEVNVRLVAATLRDLKERVAKNSFRQDLFYRLYIFPIYLPSLKERVEDIPLLAKHFVETFTPPGKKISLSEKAIEKLKGHDWPGNVRELKNVMQRALLLTKKETIEPGDLELTKIEMSEVPLGEIKLAEQERLSILSALRKTSGNHSRAARLLGVARTTLASKLRRYQIDPSEWS